MYSYTEGDRVWAKGVWGQTEERLGTVRRVTKHGRAVVKFGDWSEIMFEVDGFSNAGCFLITKYISKEDFDSTGRI